MPTVPAGQRSWKCPECGGEVLLSVAQLDPIACDNCLKKMTGGVRPDRTVSAASAPLGFWSSLPDTTKLVIAVIALVSGLVIGYVAGSKSTPAPTHHKAAPSRDSSTTDESHAHDDSSPNHEAQERPDPPGPGYKWVKGRKHKDGTYGSGHWAKDPRAADTKESQ